MTFNKTQCNRVTTASSAVISCAVLCFNDGKLKIRKPLNTDCILMKQVNKAGFDTH